MLVICMHTARLPQFKMPHFAFVGFKGKSSFAVHSDETMHFEKKRIEPLILSLFSFCNRFQDPNVKSRGRCIILGPAVCNVKETGGKEEDVQGQFSSVLYMALSVLLALKRTLPSVERGKM